MADFRRNGQRKRAQSYVLTLILFACALQADVGHATLDNRSDGDSEAAATSSTVEADLDRGEPAGSEPRSGNYLELGLAAGSFTANSRRNDARLFASFYLDGAFYKNGFFAEATVSEGANIGVTLWKSDKWVFDLIAASIFGELTEEDNSSAETEQERNDRLHDRSTLLIGSGFRLTRYSGQRLLRLQLLGDVHESEGFGSTIHVGQRWQVGNWDTRVLVGASWISNRTADYLFGIDADEATSSLPAIEIDATAVLEVSLSASYPLSRRWVVHADATLQRYDGKISRSALVDRPYETALVARIGYVF